MANERREAGLRLTRLCQQLETKVDRACRQAKEQMSKGEVLEDRLSSHAKSVESCKEALEVLRDKFQRQGQELLSSLSASRAELSEDSEKRQQGLLEAIRRGDRCLAEELMRKLGEMNDKLGSNMQGLEEGLSFNVRQLRTQLAELGDQVEAKAKERLAELRAHADQSASHAETQLCRLREDLVATSARTEASECALGEQASRLVSVDAKLAKLQDGLARADGRAAAAEQATLQRSDHLSERIFVAVSVFFVFMLWLLVLWLFVVVLLISDFILSPKCIQGIAEASEMAASGLARSRTEALEAVAEATGGVRHDFRDLVLFKFFLCVFLKFVISYCC
ncbi:unnamed protein product [Polarella glacialis]|uniref:Uncharacterized protein n=1 Tax=Polarella glacialis TaxID=89957 RepID=A0A813DPV4_POLGL|nr:unnamed protein product [Polarella glacialis]